MTDIERFNLFYAKNYERIRKYCKNYNIDEDVIHQSYLIQHRYVLERGFNDRGYYTYIIKSIINTNKNNKKRVENKKVVYIDEECLHEDFLSSIMVKMNDGEVNKYRSIYIVRKLFKYLQYELKCSDFELMIFKVYFLSKERMTYKKLREYFQVNKNDVSEIIRKIRKELLTNFPIWLEDEYRRDEINHESTKDDL